MVLRKLREAYLNTAIDRTVKSLWRDGFEADIKVSLYDLKSGTSVSYNGDQIGWAASIIKVPILGAVIREIEKGRLSLDEKLQVDHAFCLETYDPVSRMEDGSDIMVYTLMKHMISSSDNEATNILADHLGIERVNQYFQEFGMGRTMLGHLLCPGVPRYTSDFNPDGSNVTCTDDMNNLMRKIYDPSEKETSPLFKAYAKHFMGKTRSSFLKTGRFYHSKMDSKMGVISDIEDGMDEHEVATIEDNLILSVMMNKIDQKQGRERRIELERLENERMSAYNLSERVFYDLPDPWDYAAYDKMQLREDMFGQGAKKSSNLGSEKDAEIETKTPEKDDLKEESTADRIERLYWSEGRVSTYEAYEKLMNSIAFAFPNYLHLPPIEPLSLGGLFERPYTGSYKDYNTDYGYYWDYDNSVK